jgi:hypothetical protein
VAVPSTPRFASHRKTAGRRPNIHDGGVDASCRTMLMCLVIRSMFSRSNPDPIKFIKLSRRAGRQK